MTSRSRLRRAVLLVVAMGVAAAACDDGSAASAPESTTTSTERTPKAGTATITTFDVPASVACSGATSASVKVAFAAEGAVKLTLLVDGRPYDETGTLTATVDVPVHCDPLPHTFVLVAEDEDGGQTVSERELTTDT